MQNIVFILSLWKASRRTATITIILLTKLCFLFFRVEIHSAAVDGIKMYVPLEQDPFLDYTNKNHFIECNYSQAKLFHETYGRDESDEAEIFRTRAWKLLYKAKMLLDHLKIPFWLSSGTCLGNHLHSFFKVYL